MVWCDNIDYDIMLDTLKGIPFSEEYSQSLNTLILEMLHAYDCSNSTREDILSAVIELTDWVRKMTLSLCPLSQPSIIIRLSNGHAN